MKTEKIIPKYEFQITPKKTIKLSLQHNGSGYGMGINNLLEWNKKHPGKMSVEISVKVLYSVIDTPIGGISCWDTDKSYKPKTITFKTGEAFMKISKEVEIKLLDYFVRAKETA